MRTVCRCSQALLSSILNDTSTEGFIESDAEVDSTRRHHAMLSARRLDEEEDRSPEQIAKDLSKRYGGRAALHYTGDMNEIPQRLLMPSVHDASLWQVRVKVGFLFLLTMCSFLFIPFLLDRARA